jgi:hypothetical protein
VFHAAVVGSDKKCTEIDVVVEPVPNVTPCKNVTQGLARD